VKVYRSIENYTVQNTFLSIGTFDGLHLGHQQLIDRLITLAKENNAQSTVLTFWPHPRMVLKKGVDHLKLLNTIEERIEMFERLGIDHLIVYPFTETFSKLSAEAFIQTILLTQIKIKGLVIGYDHHFGHQRKGEVNCIAQAAKTQGFYLEQIKAFSQENINVSSTKIREALAEGNIPLATSYLSYQYPLTGKVISGRKIGRDIGFPTANLQVESYKFIPAKGVYAVEIFRAKQKYLGMMNIGSKPTVNDQEEEISLEVNIFDFHQQIYNEQIKVVLLEKIRNEKKFNSLEELKAQLALDKQRVIENY